MMMYTIIVGWGAMILRPIFIGIHLECAGVEGTKRGHSTSYL